MTYRQVHAFRFFFAVLLGALLATTPFPPTWQQVCADLVFAGLAAWVWLGLQPKPSWQLNIERSLASGSARRGL